MLRFHLCTKTPSNAEPRGGQRGGGEKGREGEKKKGRREREGEIRRILKERMSDNKR